MIRRVDHPALKLCSNIYHMQNREGNVTDTSVHAIDHIGHLHVADVPGRHEPGTGDCNFANILRAVRCAGYRGAVGLELYPLPRPPGEPCVPVGRPSTPPCSTAA